MLDNRSHEGRDDYSPKGNLIIILTLCGVSPLTLLTNVLEYHDIFLSTVYYKDICK